MQKSPSEAPARSDEPPDMEASVALGDLLDAGLFERLNVKERLYVALLTQRRDLLLQEGFTTMEALAMLPEPWAMRIFSHWFASAAKAGLSRAQPEAGESDPAANADVLH